MRQLVTKTSAVEKAARLARDGALDAALKQYCDLYAMYPSDWSVANALGDLYVRVGRTEDAVAHFVKLAEQLDGDGYTAKARAVYRKVLRLRPDHELAQVRVVELETRHLETGVVVNRAIAAARGDVGPLPDENGDASARDQSPAGALPLIPLPAHQPSVTLTAQMPEEPRAGEAVPPPFRISAPPPTPLSVAEGWPASSEPAEHGTESTTESARRTPTFEELLDRLDPDHAEPRESLEQALDDLDPVLAAPPARPVEDALEDMDRADEFAAIGVNLPQLEPLDPEEAISADDDGEGAVVIDEGEAEQYESVVLDAGGSTAGADDQTPGDGDETVREFQEEPGESNIANGSSQHQEEYDFDSVDWDSVDDDAQEPGACADVVSSGREDSAEPEADSLEADSLDADTLEAEDSDADELARLLSALEDQARGGARTALFASPDTAIALHVSEDHACAESATGESNEFAQASPFALGADDELVDPVHRDGAGDPDVEVLEFAGIDTGASTDVTGEPEEEEVLVDVAGLAGQELSGLEYHLEESGAAGLEPRSPEARTEDAPDSGALVDSTSAEELFEVAAPSPSARHYLETTWPVAEPWADEDVPAACERDEAAVAAVEERFDPAELRLIGEPALDAGPGGDGPPARECSPDERFEEIRITILDGVADGIQAGLNRADELVAAGELARAAHLLQETMCALPLRHAACARLARIYRETGDIASAMECLEWAAEREPAERAAGHELAYELALTLDAMGQRDHALGIYRELLSEVGPTFRDVAARAAGMEHGRGKMEDGKRARAS